MSNPLAGISEGLGGDRECPVCKRDVPDGAGVYYADLGLRSHRGACDAQLHVMRRDYSRSGRGRRRSRALVLKILGVKCGSQRETTANMFAHLSSLPIVLDEIAKLNHEYVPPERHVELTTRVIGRLWHFILSRS